MLCNRITDFWPNYVVRPVKDTSWPDWDHLGCCPMRTISLNLCCLLHGHATFFPGRGYMNGFKFKLNLDGTPPLRTCVKRCSCQSLSVTQQMHAVLPEALAACPPERAAPGRPFRLCQGRAQTRPCTQAFVVLCLLDLRVIPVAWLYVSRVRDTRSFAVCVVPCVCGTLLVRRDRFRRRHWSSSWFLPSNSPPLWWPLAMCLLCMIDCMTSGFLAVTSCGVAGVQRCRDWVRGGVEDRVGEFVLGERGDAGR